MKENLYALKSWWKTDFHRRPWFKFNISVHDLYAQYFV